MNKKNLTLIDVYNTDENKIMLIDIFGKVVKENNNLPKESIMNVFTNGLKLGYIIHPDAINDLTYRFTSVSVPNYNSTFYKTFSDVKNMSRIKLLFDQVLHYATTYGTDFTMFNGYVANTNPELKFIDSPDFKAFKVITACSEEEMYKLCYDLLCSGIALKSCTVKVVSNYIISYLIKYGVNEFSVDAIKNKEAIPYICHELNILPNDKFSLIRYIVYLATGSTMLIKDKNTIYQIKTYYNSYAANYLPDIFSRLSEKNIIELSSIFYRFKPIFLACKNHSNAAIINKIRRYAVKYHTPMKENIANNLFSYKYSTSEIIEFANKVNIYKLIALINNAKNLTDTPSKDMFIIRNGKVWIEEFNRKNIDKQYINKVYNILYNILLEKLRKNKCVVKFNDFINIACPTSEKNFIGDIPIGSNINIGEKNFFGIYWRNEWGTRDFDLSYIDMNLFKIGWNSDFYSNRKNVIYSGDMTNANPEATEVIYLEKNGLTPGLVYINRYNGENNSKYQYIFGKYKNVEYHTCVDPNDILFRADCISTERQQIIGITTPDKFYFSTLGNGNNIVSFSRFTEEKYVAIENRLRNSLMLKEVLLNSGYIEYDPNAHYDESTKIIDLSAFTKNDIISIFNI